MTTTTAPTSRPKAGTTATSPRQAESSGQPVTSGQGITPRQAAITAGIGYVLLFFGGIFANFFVREQLIDSSDAVATAANIAESETLFRFGIVTFLVIFALDVVVAWAIHIVLRNHNHDLSLLGAWLRLVYTVFLGVAIIFLLQALNLLSGSAALSAIPVEQLQAQALAAFDLFNTTWLIGLAAFGLHLITVGVVLVKTKLAPRLLGFAIMVAGSVYVIDTVAFSLLANYADYEDLFVAMVAIPAVIGEAWFGLWLLLRAGKNHAGSSPISN